MKDPRSLPRPEASGEESRESALRVLARRISPPEPEQALPSLRNIAASDPAAIAKLIALTPASIPKDVEAAGHVSFLSAAAVKPRRIRWLWADYIPLGKLTILDGDPGNSKSTLMLDLAARVSRGLPMPFAKEAEDPAHAIICSAEDDADDTIVPRLMAAGGDLRRVLILREAEDLGLELPRDLQRLGAVIGKLRAKLVILDPLVAFLDEAIRTIDDKSVRQGLGPISALAHEMGSAVVGIRHLNKGDSRRAIYKGGGSIGIGGHARSVLIAAVDPEDPGRRVLASVKSNLSPQASSLTYRCNTMKIEIEGEPEQIPKITWEGESELKADDLVQDEIEGSALQDAKDFLRQVLTDAGGKMLGREIKAAAAAAGIAWRTVERAKAELKITGKPEGFKGPWTWYLPKDPKGGATE